MKKSLTFKCLALCILAAMLFTGCSPAPGYTDSMTYTAPKVLSTVSVNNAADGEQLYAQNESFSLYVNEKLATFAIADNATGTRWDSVPNINPEDYVGKDNQLAGLRSLMQVSYSNTLNVINNLRSYSDSVQKGTVQIERLENGACFVFSFADAGFVVPIQVVLRGDGVDVSLVNARIQESKEEFKITSVSVAPYFSAPALSDEGYIVIPDGTGALVDWNNAADSGVEYRQPVYGQDNAVIVSEKKAEYEAVRIPVFGNQYKTATQDGEQPQEQSVSTASKGFTAIITEGAARAAINAKVGGRTVPYSSVYAEFIYRETAFVKNEKKNQTVRIVESSNTAIPVQTVRYVLMEGQELDYVDMAANYRKYLLAEKGIKPTAKPQSAPMVVEFFGGVMKQQFVMGFPVDQVVPLTTFEDAQNIVKKLKAAGVQELVINFTEWQKDATGAAMQNSIKPEGNLGGNSQLKKLIALCKQEGVAVYLDVNTTRMVDSAMGYDTSYDSVSSLRRDPAMQYYYKANTGKADLLNPSFLLTPTKMLKTAQQLAKSADKYELTGLATNFLGENLYSDFSKYATTRDHAQYYWNDALKALADAKNNLLTTGGNAYVLGYTTLITDTPVEHSGHLIERESIPLYQIALHGLVDMTGTALNESSDVRGSFLYAIETGIGLKWNWTAKNQDELVETNYNGQISTHYENWFDQAVSYYKEAQSLLQSVSRCTIVEHNKISDDQVRVVWSNGTTVLINYGMQAAVIDGVEVAAQGFVVKGGPAA